MIKGLILIYQKLADNEPDYFLISKLNNFIELLFPGELSQLFTYGLSQIKKNSFSKNADTD
jgi:hypothetical protein